MDRSRGGYGRYIGRAELHFHLLPAVDDGPATMAESLALARAAVSDGTDTIVATPHVRSVAVEELADRVAELRDALASAGIALEVRTGGELDDRDVPRISRSQLELIAQGPAGARWVLLEAPLFEPRVGELVEAISMLHDQDLGVLLAHPERVGGPGEETYDELRRRVPAGMWIQVNATSILGRHGQEVERRAIALLAEEERVVVASDAHRPSRGPGLGPAAKALHEHGVPPERIARAVDTGPRRLLDEGIALRARSRPVAVADRRSRQTAGSNP